MQELVGRLTALDPAASESLKVIGYFDALVGGQVSIDVLARSAAVLAGCVAGVRTASGRVVRAAPSGARLDGGADAPGGPTAPGEGWPGERTPDGSAVWIERADAAHANDAMLVERFAIAVAITLSRAGSDTG